MKKVKNDFLDSIPVENLKTITTLNLEIKPIEELGAEKSKTVILIGLTENDTYAEAVEINEWGEHVVNHEYASNAYAYKEKCYTHYLIIPRKG